jgi:hypothetical protein
LGTGRIIRYGKVRIQPYQHQLQDGVGVLLWRDDKLHGILGGGVAVKRRKPTKKRNPIARVSSKMKTKVVESKKRKKIPYREPDWEKAEETGWND